MEAYTYSLKHLSTGKIYYGVRKSTNDDLFVTYFSSSKLVKFIIEQEGKQAFSYKIRKRFSSYEEALLYEHKLLNRIKAVSNPKVLNQAVSSPVNPLKDKVSEQNRKSKISQTMKDKWKTEEYRNNHPFLTLSREEYSRRGKKGNEQRLKNLVKKPKSPKKYGDVSIIKNGQVKIIKSNQVPAYKAIGWTRL